MQTQPKFARRLATPDQVAALDGILTHVQPADAEADQCLFNSLKIHGQLAPILRRGGQLVDGRRRVYALTKLGIEPWIIDLDVGAEGAEAPDLLGRSFFELNACRRELSLAVRAAIADSLATLRRGDNQHSSDAMSREDAARAMGVSADTLDRYRKAKSDPDTHTRVMSGELSLPQAVRKVEAKALAAKAKYAAVGGTDVRTDLDQLTTSLTQFSLIYADPPWDYESNGDSPTHCSDPARYYATLSLAEIKALPVARVAAKDSVLWMWAPNSYISRALDVMAAWGFRYVTSAVWIKRHGSPTPGAVRPTHETLLMGRRGSGVATVGAPMISVHEDNSRRYAHSQKPEHFAQELERLYPDVAKLELFSRQSRPGWTALGNQCGTIPVVGGAANDDQKVSSKKSQRKRKHAEADATNKASTTERASSRHTAAERKSRETRPHKAPKTNGARSPLKNSPKSTNEESGRKDKRLKATDMGKRA